MVELTKYRTALDELASQTPQIEAAAAMLRAVPGGDTVYTCGNGGSASIASHFAADLGRAGRKALCLCDSVPVLTALANDHDYSEVFSRQIQSMTSQDVLVMISSSGDSLNLVRGAQQARDRRITVIGITGFGGGTLRLMADLSIVLSSRSYSVVEGVHSCLCHVLTDLVRGAA